jgi:tetratricopeptide (TPR) repeat protein
MHRYRKDQDKLLVSYMYGHDKRARAAELFSKKFLEKTISENREPEKVAACLSILSLTNPGRNLAKLEKIYSNDPRSRDLLFLVSREINKLESWLWTPKITGSSYPAFYYDQDHTQDELNLRSDILYSGEVLKFLKKVMSDPQISEADKLFLSMAAAYVEILRGNVKEAERMLVRDPGNYPSPKYRLQAKVIALLLNMHTKGPDRKFEWELLALLHEIATSGLFDSPQLYYEQLIRTVAEYYKTKPELRAKGFLLSTGSGLVRSGSEFFIDDVYQNAGVDDIDNIMSIIRKKNKDAFETFITRGQAMWRHYHGPEYTEFHDDPEDLEPLDTLRLIDTKGIKLMREDKLAEALEVYSPLSDSVLNTEPFSYVRDNVFIFRNFRISEFLYNKKTFLEQLIRYKQELSLNPDNALINYYVGNAYLNMTIHGNAWPMMSNFVSSGISNKEYAELVNHHFAFADRALPYFVKALQNAPYNRLKILVQINLAFVKNIPLSDSSRKLATLKKLCADKAEEETLLKVYTNCDIYYDYLAAYVRKGNRIAPPGKWMY